MPNIDHKIENDVHEIFEIYMTWPKYNTSGGTRCIRERDRWK